MAKPRVEYWVIPGAVKGPVMNRIKKNMLVGMLKNGDVGLERIWINLKDLNDARALEDIKKVLKSV